MSHDVAVLQGLKTGMYYLRTRPAANAIQFTVDQSLVQRVREEKQKTQDTSSSGKQQQQDKDQEAMACSLQNREACLMCSS